MSIHTRTCTFCRGSGVAERLEERTNAGNWVPNTQLAQSLWDAAVQAMPAGLRLDETDCPRCDGRGEYEIESVTCKIF